ncbi:MAG: hypothetical protein ACLQFR_09405 [Streptosporangiaceae bacterium]
MANRKFGWRALVAAAASGLIALTLIGAVPAGAASAGRRSGVAAEAQWRLSDLLTGSQLFSVSATSAHDAWAVGYRTRAGHVGNGLLLHWNGRKWRPVSYPRQTTYSAYSVTALSAHDVWLFPFFDSTPSALMHWNGSRWSTLALPGNENMGLVVTDADIWIVGGTGATCGSALSCTVLSHWNGHSWRSYRLPASVRSVSGTSPSDVWAIGWIPVHGGNGTGRPVLFRWKGSAWSRVALDAQRTAGAPSLTAVSARDVWVGDAPQGHPTACAMHWNGKVWRPFYVPTATIAFCGEIVSDGRDGVWIGPFVHWTGRKLVKIYPVMPFQHGKAISLGGMSDVPGSSAVWNVGWLQGPRKGVAGYIAALGG